MPSTICSECRTLMDYFYRFKQICRTSDTKLKQYPITGIWHDPLELPKIEKSSPPATVSSSKVKNNI